MEETLFPRVCIASTSGGGGKTLATVGIGRALARRGHVVKPFKKGPDFIDAAWLGRACGISATNLDPFFLSPAQCRALFRGAVKKAISGLNSPISLIEGNRGLYDGLDSSGAVSTAALARALNVPIILCINCAKCTRTVAAILRGIISFEPDLTFGGVILNQIGSSRHERNLREAVESLTPLRVLGALPRQAQNPLPERHMGLACRGAGLAENIEEALDALARFAEAHLDLDAILETARQAGPLPENDGTAADAGQTPCHAERTGRTAPRIGYVEDDALWFYYPENLAALENAGASLARLSLLDSSAANLKKWENLDALYLGGGFPEDFAAQISASPVLRRVFALAQAGMPVYAECGGLIVLCASLEREGAEWPMAHVFSAKAQWHARPCGLGYIEATVIGKNPYFPLGMTLRGHEFHYSSCVFPAALPEFGLKTSRGSGLHKEGDSGWDAMLIKNVWASYTHIFSPAVPCWAHNFAAAASKFHAGCVNLAI